VTAVSLANLRSPFYEAYAHAILAAHCAAITATDLPEHLTKPDVLQTFDDEAAALAPDGAWVGRVPNSVSPLGRHIPNGDLTRQTSFTACGIHRVAAAVSFDSVLSHGSPPVGCVLASAAGAAVRQIVSACYRIALAAETGMHRGQIVIQNLTFAARKGAELAKPAEN
jgi:hypothetical protein